MNHSSVFRYGLKLEDYQEISVPTAHQVLSAAPARDRYAFQGKFEVIGTGNPLPKHYSTGGSLDLIFINTCVMENGLVWHVFTGPLKRDEDNE